jgi:predicted transcriptional regulator
MSLINMPHVMIFEEYMKLPPDEKEKYVQNTIKDILKLNRKNGVTLKQMEENTYFYRKTISYHLENLVAKGEVYKYPPDSRSALFFPNGNLADPILQEDITLENKIYSIYLMSNQYGNFVYIQEKEIGIDGVVNVKGGIMIPFDERKKFFEDLIGITKLFNVSKSKLEN